MAVIPTLTNGPQSYYSLGTATLGTISTGPAYLMSFMCTNHNGTLRYLQFFNSGTVGNGGTPFSSWPLSGGNANAPGQLIIDTTFFSPGTTYPGRHFGTAITWAISTTQGTLGTANIALTEHSLIARFI